MMATSSTPKMGPIKLIFLDIPAGVAIDEIIELTTPFHDFLAVLSRMSASVQEQIQGLGRRYEAKESGLNLSDGCWWYRIVKITSSVKIASINAQGAEKTLSQHTKGDWCRLATLFAYDHMREIELVGGLPMDQGWVEVHHVTSSSDVSSTCTYSLTLYNVGSSEEA